MGFFQSIRERFTTTREQRELLARLSRRERVIRSKLIESMCDDIENIVDPRDEFEGWNMFSDAEFWRRQGENTLKTLRDKMRRIQAQSGIALGAIEAVCDYVVGTGLTYDYQVPKDIPDAARETWQSIADDANAVWRDFVRRERWTQLEQQLVEQADADGEVFLRMFPGENGDTAVRYVDPDAVYDAKGHHKWGVITAPNDAQHVVGYTLGMETVPAAEMLHVPLNVPPDVLRGVPSLWPVRDNVLRGESITRNVAKLAAVQAAVAVVRKHAGILPSAQGQAMLDNLADKTKQNIFTGKTLRQQRIEGGTIWDVDSSTTIEFPTGGGSLDKFPPALLMNLRPIAVRMGLPDFVVTGDVSAANFASVFTSMAPSAKRLARKQARYLREFQRLHEFVLSVAVNAGTLPVTALRLVSQVTGPEVANRDEVAQTNKRDVLFRNRILSRKTWASEEGYDFEQEAANIEQDEAMDGAQTGALPVPNASNSPEIPDSSTAPAEGERTSSGSPTIDAAVAAAGG